MAGTAAAVRTGLAAPAVTGAFAHGGAAGGAAMGAGFAKKAIPLIGGALATVGIANFFGDAVDAASDLQESANAVRVSFGDARAEIEKLGSTSADRLGLSQVDFNALAVRLSSFAGKIAGEGGDVASVIDTLTTRGADFASVYNIDVSDALLRFQSGLAGEIEPLRNLAGIDLSAAATNAFALANGIGEVGRQLTDDEKVLARYGLLMQETSKTEGDFANTSEQLANQQRRNAAKFEDALADIGVALLPAATAFAQFVGKEENAALLQRMVEAFIRMEPAITNVAEFMLLLADNSIRVLDAFGQVLDMFTSGKITVDDFNKFLDAMPDYLKSSIVGVGDFVLGIANPIIGFFNRVIEGAEGAINAIRQLFGMSGTISLQRIAPLTNMYRGIFANGLFPGTSRATGLSQTQMNQLGFPGMAAGGSVAGAGWSWVGERGPELRFMPAGAEVIPNDVAGQGLDLSPKTLRALDQIMAERVALYLDGQDVARSVGSSNVRSSALGAA